MTDATITPAAIKETFGFDSNFVELPDGGRVHYLDEGPRDGVPVVFLHGSAIGITSAANFYLNIPAAAKAGYRVLCPDLYGYGWTEKPADKPANIFSQGEQIMQFLDALGVKQTYIVGNSLGGRISVRLCMESPERFLGCVLIGAGGAIWPQARFAATYATEQAPKEVSRETVHKAMLKLVDNPEVVSPKLVDFRARMATRAGEAERYYESTSNRGASAQKTVLDIEAAQKCQVPMLIIYGREDRVGPPENALACAEAFPNSDLIVFGHCGHWTMIERAQDFNAFMLRFFGGYDRRIVSPPVVSNDLRAETLPEG